MSCGVFHFCIPLFDHPSKFDLSRIFARSTVHLREEVFQGRWISYAVLGWIEFAVVAVFIVRLRFEIGIAVHCIKHSNELFNGHRNPPAKGAVGVHGKGKSRAVFSSMHSRNPFPKQFVAWIP
jgi:hypothetical protein